MSVEVKQWQESEGKTDEQMAELLTQRLGRTISVQGFKLGRARKVTPPEWLHALGIAPQEPAASDDVPPSAENPAAPADRGGDRTVLPLPFDPAPVRVQLILVHELAGKGAGIAMSRRYHEADPRRENLVRMQVSNMWTAAAPGIADAWIKWAKESPTVAQTLTMLTLGGAKGELLQSYAVLFVGSLITAGALDGRRFVPPDARPAQETDRLADDGSTVINFTTAQGAENGSGDEPRTRRPRTRA